jgi:hypothetical protein
MKETFGMVPQVFYDLIGRVLPGAATILGGLIILSDRRPVGAVDLLTVREVTITSAALLVAAWLFFSYLVGALLGAVAFAVFEDDRHGRTFKDVLAGFVAVLGFRLTADAECSKNLDSIKAVEPAGTVIDGASLSYAYDFILLRDAGAGSRLAKLRAEIHMCRVLMLACVSLGAVYAFQRLSLILTWSYWLTLLSLGAIARFSYLLDVHLAVRARRLVANCWAILKKEDARTAAAHAQAARADS